jgi:hypothetical protein
MQRPTTRTSSSGVTGFGRTHDTSSAFARTFSPVTTTMGNVSQVRSSRDLLLHGISAESRKTKVQDKKIGCLCLDLPEREQAVARLSNVVSSDRERLSKHPAQRNVILNDQHRLLTRRHGEVV